MTALPASPLAGLGLWVGAAALALGVHLGAGWWMMRLPAPSQAEAGPPPSILIDMEPMPAVAEAGEAQLAPDAVDSIAVPPADPAPVPVEQPAETPRDKPVEAPPAPAAAKARAEAPVAPRPTGARDVATKADRAAAEAWKTRLFAHLLRRKPRSVGESGTATVSFTVDAAGNMVSAGLVRSSGSARIDAAVLTMLRRASPVPAPPAGAPRTITVPIRFE